jgi:outer membrane receptor for ferrienterochelin and colicin
MYSHFFLVRFFIMFSMIIVSATTALHAQSGGGTVDGTIADRDTKQPIAGARILVVGTQRGAIANARGEFAVSGLQPGTYRLQISAPEYKTMIRSDVRIGSTQSTKIDIELSLALYKAQEVTVAGGRTLIEKIDDMRVSANQLTQEEIRRAPGAVEDVSRMVQILPGVAFGSDARNDIIARGGSPVENFLMIDGIEVPNINHYAQQGASGGPIGMINVDFLNDVNFSAGGFGAKYGDRLSSIMDINYREGDKRGYHGKFDLGLGGFGAILEGPIQTDKSSFMVSARRSYLDLVAGGTGLTGVPNYWNFNAKATFVINNEHKLSIIGLGGIDNIKFDDYKSTNKNAVSNRSAESDGGRYIVGIAHRWLLGTQTFVRTSVSANAYRSEWRDDSVVTNQDNIILNRINDARNQSLDREVVLRSDLSHRFSLQDLLEVGIVARRITNDNVLFQRANTTQSQNTQEFTLNTLTSATKLGSYAQYTRNFSEAFSMTAGLRWDYFDYLNNTHALSPRLSMSYALSNQFRINLGGGLYQQAPSLIWLVPDDRNRNVDMMKTYQAIAGVEYFPAEDWKFSLETYTKEYRDYPVSAQNPQFVYSSAGADWVTPFEYIRTGSNGFARGVEVFAQKKLTDDFYGMVSYSFSSIRFTDGLGTERSSAFDYRTMLTIVGGYKITPALEISAKIRYAGGRPYTPFDLTASRANNRGILDYSRTNQERFPDYRRVDIRADYRMNVFGWNMLVFVDLQNAFNIENPETIIWNRKTNAPSQILQWQFLPVGGVKIEF